MGGMDFNLELGNVHMKMVDDPNVRGQEDEEEEEEETEMIDEQEVISTDPSNQA
jgi:hypothetical protein